MILSETEAASEQTRALSRHLNYILRRNTLIYCLVWAALSLIYQLFLSDWVESVVLDITTTPITVSKDEYEIISNSPNDYLVQPTPDGGAIVRQLEGYKRVRSFKYLAVIVVFFVGYVIIVLRVLQRSLSYFRELSEGIAYTMANRTSPIRLSSPLAIMQAEMNEMREDILNHERTAKESERRKNELVAYLAHDLRTPLTSVVGYLSLLHEAPDLPEEQRDRFVAIALDKAEALDSLTSEFFEITRYNLSSIPIERSKIDMRVFLMQIAESFYPLLMASSMKAEVNAPSGETAFVDSNKMARAIGNIIRNAISYAAPDTAIEIDAKRPASGEGWIIAITNKGQEIAPEHIERIFDQFIRVDSSRKQDGHAGLGLAIAREIVQAHGGTICAASSDGLTTFTIELP